MRERTDFLGEQRQQCNRSAQLISFDAALCFNEIAEWLRDLNAFRKPSFASFVRVVHCDEFDVYGGGNSNCDIPKPEDWERGRQNFEVAYASHPSPWNRAYCDALDSRRGVFTTHRGWRFVHGQGERVAMLLNYGDVHAFQTDVDGCWRDLPELWDRFEAIRNKAGLASAVPPWRNSEECILPVVSEDELWEFESELIRIADRFELARSSSQRLRFCDGKSLSELNPCWAWVLPEAWYEPAAYLPWATDDRRCDFQNTTLPLYEREQLERWEEPPCRYQYLECQKCGRGELFYRLIDSREVVRECEPNTIRAVAWRARKQNALLFALWRFRQAWCYVESARSKLASPRDGWRRSNQNLKEALARWEVELLQRQHALDALSEIDQPASQTLPLTQRPEAVVTECEPGDKLANLLHQEMFDFSLGLVTSMLYRESGAPALFMQELKLLRAAVPADQLAAVPDLYAFFDDAHLVGQDDSAESVKGCGTDKRRDWIRDRANALALQYLRDEPRITVRALAAKIECSTGLISKLPAWRAVQDALKHGLQPKKLKTVSLSDKVLAVKGRNDDELNRLIADADSEPSPLESDEPDRSRRVYRPR